MALRARIQRMPVDVWLHGETLPDAPDQGDTAPTPSPQEMLEDASGRVMVLTRGVDREPHGFGVAAVCTIPAGVVVAKGLIDRLVAELERPGRRLVRIDTGGAPVAIWHPELLGAAGVPVADVLDDRPGLDHAVWERCGADLEPGQWRHWVDGERFGAIDARALGARDALTWAAGVERDHALPNQLRAQARLVGQRVRREATLARRRHR